MAEIKKRKKEEKVKAASAQVDCFDRTCPFHGGLKARGRVFEGIVIRKFPRRITIEFERMVKIGKYERFMRERTKIHARIPNCLEKEISVGDLVRVQECRPLSKIIHFIVIKKIKAKEESKK